MRADASQAWVNVAGGFWGNDLNTGPISAGREIITAAMALWDIEIARGLQNARDAKRANKLLRQGKFQEAKAIVDANKNLEMEQARTETSVTVVDNGETNQTLIAIVAYGQPGTGRNNVGTNFQRAAAQTKANLQALGWIVIEAGEISSLYGFRNVLNTAAREGASVVFIYSHGAGNAIDLGDGDRNDRKDITLTNVDSLRNNGFTGLLVLKACYTGSSNSGIAAALSRRLGVEVEAPTMGMSFSPFPDRPGPSKIHPSTRPTYMIPEGNGRLVMSNNGDCLKSRNRGDL